MHVELFAVPAVMFAAGILAVESGTVSESWVPIAGPISATAAVIFTVQQFLKRQKEISEDSARNIAGIVESNNHTQDKIVERLAAMDTTLGHVRENVAKLVDRNTNKDAA